MVDTFTWKVNGAQAKTQVSPRLLKFIISALRSIFPQRVTGLGFQPVTVAAANNPSLPKIRLTDEPHTIGQRRWETTN